MSLRFCHPLLLIMVFTGLGVAASAQTPAYYVDGSRPDNSGDGRSWAAAKRTIQAAINASSGPHQIWVRGGTYAESITLHSGVALYGGFAGAETQLSDRDSKTNLTVIDGSQTRDGQPAYHVVTMNAISGAELNGFVITGGKAVNQASPDSDLDDRNQGGGIFCKSLTGTNQVNECRVHGNTAGIYGGGLYCADSALVVGNSIFQENRAFEGGGVFCRGGAVRLTDCAIQANTGEVTAGIHGDMTDAGASLMIHQCTIAANHADHGGNTPTDLSAGGVYLSGSSISTIELANCLIAGNEAHGAGGVLVNSGSPRLVHCTIVNNTSHLGHGGGLFIFGDNFTQCYNTLFAGNQPYSVYENSPSVDPLVVNCLFNSDASAKGDYFDEHAISLRGAAAINAIPDHQARNNVDGLPQFVMSPNMAWSAASIYDRDTQHYTFTDAGANWRPGELAGRLIIPDTSRKTVGLILDNTTTTIVTADLTWAIWNYSSKAGTKWQFVDYRPGCGSPAIDSGFDASPYTQDRDRLGNARPFNIAGFGGETGAATYDIGAYEAIIDHARIRVTPDGDPLDFGSVDILDGPSAPRSVTITNIGFMALDFTAPGFRIIGDANDFSTTTNVAATPLNPGASRTINFTFDPTTTGTKRAALLIATQDPDRPVTTVTLAGQGILPAPLITLQPKSQTLNPGNRATFAIAATGRAPLGYRWYRASTPLADDDRISGSGTTTLTLRRISQRDEGFYYCIVTPAAGPAGYSSLALLGVNPTLHIISAYGQASPAPGDHIVPKYSEVTVSMATPTVNGPPADTRVTCTGWSASNLQSGSGSGLSQTLYMNSDTTLTWNWKTQYYLRTAADPANYGSVVPGPGWVDSGKAVTVEARPLPLFDFAGWSGDAAGTASPCLVLLDAPRSVTATFAPQPKAAGTVSITVWPLATAWSLKDGYGRVRQGKGTAQFAGVPGGALTLTWGVPAGYEAPGGNPVTRNLAQGGGVSFVEVLRPGAGTMRRKASDILRSLLGLASDPTGLDLNDDRKVSIEDLLLADQ